MCIAVLTRPGKIITNDALYRGWTANRDGGGFAFVKDGRVRIQKGYRTYNDFQKAYEEVANEYGKDSPMLVHMRIRTSGDTDADNTHPFRIKSGALIHNGIMFTPHGDLAKNGNKYRSDTNVFAKVLSKKLIKEDVRAAKREIGDAIGIGNKIAILYHDRDFDIINESAGFWRDDIWYSNGSCGVTRG